MPARTLALLERCREDFSPGSRTRKRASLGALTRSRLRTADQVRRLHEVLCFMRAYPDDAALLQQVEQMLTSFGRRSDLRAHREELSHSGIAGTLMWFPFFYPTAHWLAQRCPDALRLDRTDTVAAESIAKALPGLMTPLEGHALREAHLPGYRALDALRGKRTDATFLVERVAAMPGDDVSREDFYDLINPSCELLPAPGTPTRTTAVFGRGPRAWQTQPLRHARPDLRTELRRPPGSLRRVSLSDGRALVTLARESMITRSRDLDAFVHGNEADVWLCDNGGGLAFALIGMLPARRAALPAIYGGLTLQNGVPIGYHQADLLGRSAAVSFNTFETFRGGESAYTFGRLLATLRAFSGVTSFSVEPYQLGQGNDEGIESGAWWFYYKLGFRPRARAALQLAATEVQRQRKRPAHRSTPETLRRLAAHHVLFDLDPTQPTPLLLPTNIGLRVGAALARLAPADRTAAMERANALAMRLCGLASLRGFTRDERAAWQALTPLLAALPVDNWTRPERAALVPLVCAKGARSERDYARLIAAHARLLKELAVLSRPTRERTR